MDAPQSLSWRNSKDVWAGAMLIAIGVAAILIARDYPFGTTLRMGPGYFPSLLGGLLILFGLYVFIKGFRSLDPITGSWSFRALILLTVSLILFGFLMEHAGFVPALVVLIFGSSAAGREFKLIEVLACTVVLTAVSVVVFIWGLGLPYPLFSAF
jgi:hypothetical protein